MKDKAANESAVKYPDITVNLVGGDGNAFSILGRVNRALVKHNIDSEAIDEFMDEAMSGDYDHLLRTVCAYVEVT